MLEVVDVEKSHLFAVCIAHTISNSRVSAEIMAMDNVMLREFMFLRHSRWSIHCDMMDCVAVDKGGHWLSVLFAQFPIRVLSCVSTGEDDFGVGSAEIMAMDDVMLREFALLRHMRERHVQVRVFRIAVE